MVLRITRRNETKRAAPALPKRWECSFDLAAEGVKKFDVVEKDGAIVDYRNVRITGYLSTFGNVDRDGETVLKGAFEDTLQKFRMNPVLLINHRNDIESVAGSFTTIREDEQGLFVEATISNAPSDRMRELRSKVAEGHIRTLSMGGLFHFDETGRNIFKVDLYEGSLVAIPANPKATFSVRSLNPAEVKRWKADPESFFPDAPAQRAGGDHAAKRWSNGGSV